jgi:hypothetical protein
MKNYARCFSLSIIFIGIIHSYENDFEPRVGFQLGYPNIIEVHGGICYTVMNVLDTPSGPMAVASVGDAYSMIGLGVGGYNRGQGLAIGGRFELDCGYIYSDRTGIDSHQIIYGAKFTWTAYHIGIIRGRDDRDTAIQVGIQLEF